MIDYALTSLQPVAQTQAAPAGLLYASTADLLTWGMALIALAALCLMPGQLRESAKALYAPIGAFFAALHAPLAFCVASWMVLYVLAAAEMGYFRPLFCVCLVFSVISAWPQLLREGFWGWWPPLKV